MSRPSRSVCVEAWGISAGEPKRNKWGIILLYGEEGGKGGSFNSSGPRVSISLLGDERALPFRIHVENLCICANFFATYSGTAEWHKIRMKKGYRKRVVLPYYIY